MMKLEIQLVPSLSSGLALDSAPFDDEETTSALSIEPSRITTSTLQVISELIGITNSNLTTILGCIGLSGLLCSDRFYIATESGI